MNGRTLRAILPAVLAALPVAIPSSVLAQSSTTYRLTEQMLNGGGRPAQAVTSSSSSYRLSLDSIGEPIAHQSPAAASYRMEAGFTSAFPPPGEVNGLGLLAGQTLTWLPEPASTAFNVYSGPLSTLPGGAYGACAAPRITETTWADPSVLAPRTGRFYLVTGANRLWEEGTKGSASSGAERPNLSPCP